MQNETIVEVVNRTTKPLDYLWDGCPGVIPPGYKVNDAGVVVPAGRDGQVRTHHMMHSLAEMARRQNVKRGTEDRWTGEVEMLIGVAQRDENGVVTMAPNWVFNDISYTDAGNAVERFDRSKMGEADRGAHAIPASGFPRGRLGVEIEAGRAGNEGPVGLMPGGGS